MTALPRGFAAALVWIVCAWTATAVADSLPSPGQFQGQPIIAIDLVGPTAPDRATFEQVTRMRRGRAYSAAAIRRAIVDLATAGDWSDIRFSVDPRDAGVALTVTFVPRVRISRVQFQGHHQSTGELRKAVGLKPGDEFVPAEMAAGVDRLRTWYEESGYIVDITPSVMLEGGGTKASVTFLIRQRERVRLQSLTFPGTPAFSKLRQWMILRTAPGEYVTRDYIERGVERLRRFYHDQGFLKAALGTIEWHVSPAGLTIAIPIERGTRYRVDVTGFDAQEIEAQMTFFDDVRDDERSLADESERLEHFLSNQGYRNAAVHIRRHQEDDTVVIQVAVEPGPQFPLEDVRITGNIAASDEELKTPLVTTPGSGGFVRIVTFGFWGPHYVQDDLIDADRERIVAWYRLHGFLSTTVTASVEETPDPPSATAVFAVEEGPQTRIHNVLIEGGGTVPLQATLQRYDLLEGSPYVEIRLRSARTTILEAYSQLGYVYATVDVSPTLSPDRTQADIAIRINEGLAVTVGTITLSGNERTRDHAILRELTIQPGDPFNPQQIFENQRQVAQLGFLREVRLTPVNPEIQEPVKDLRLSVKERDAGIVDLGVGYSNYEGPRGFAEITYRNLMGMGRRGSLRLEGSRIEQKVVLSYRHPWLLNQRIDGKAALFHEVREEETRNYQWSGYGVSFGVDRTLRPRLYGSLVYDYQVNDFQPLDPLTPPDLLPFDQDRSNVASITPSIVWNTRDDLFNPRTGMLATVAFESAALLLGSQEQFWKITAGANHFTPVTNRIVLALGTRAGVASRFGETRQALEQEAIQGNKSPQIALLLPPNERFYNGGRSSVRGYQEDTLGPKLEDGTPTGGNVFLVLNAEFRVTVVGSLGVVAFWDGGNVWLGQDDVRWTDIKTTVGLGLRYNTPVGPLRLDYGYKLNRDPRPPDPDGAGPLGPPPREAPGAFHFTLGHAF